MAITKVLKNVNRHAICSKWCNSLKIITLQKYLANLPYLVG